MEIKIPTTKTVEVTDIRLELAVRYEDEEMPYDFPLRSGDMWRATVEIDTGKIKDWPKGKDGAVEMKVCDEGTYTLLDKDGNTVAELRNEYVPHGIVPGEYGDYVNLQIDPTGTITNWPSNPEFSDFFQEDD